MSSEHVSSIGRPVGSAIDNMADYVHIIIGLAHEVEEDTTAVATLMTSQ